MKLMGQVCALLPSSYKRKCNDFNDKYGKQIVEFLMSSVAPHSICALLHLCLMEEASTVGEETQREAQLHVRGRNGTCISLLTSPEMLPPSSDCQACRHLLVLSRLHLGLHSTRPIQTSDFLGSVCLQHPNAIPKVHPPFTSGWSQHIMNGTEQILKYWCGNEWKHSRLLCVCVSLF